MILLHGWEGSAESTYVLHSGRYLYDQGYNVFRLNFRDHGNTHHLNEGVFYAILLDEVFNAVKTASGLKSPSRVFLMGFSLGGNFALRIARRCSDDTIENLRHVVAVSPAIDPGKATDALDASLLLRWYFLKKWRRSLALKQKLYPHLYDFGDIMNLETLRALTDALLKKYSSYKDTHEYFMGYTLTGESMKALSIPTNIIAFATIRQSLRMIFQALCWGLPPGFLCMTSADITDFLRVSSSLHGMRNMPARSLLRSPSGNGAGIE